MRSLTSRNTASFIPMRSALEPVICCEQRACARRSVATTSGGVGVPGRIGRDEIVELHAVAAGSAAEKLEGFVEIEAVAFGENPLGLLDLHARRQRVLELGAPLVGGLRHREQPADRHRRLDRAVAEVFEGLALGLLLHRGDCTTVTDAA